MGAWLWKILISLDQLANTMAGPLLNWLVHPAYLFGFPDETLSSVFGKNVRVGRCRGCRWLCLLLNRLERKHCEKAIEVDEGTLVPDQKSLNKLMVESGKSIDGAPAKAAAPHA